MSRVSDLLRRRSPTTGPTLVQQHAAVLEELADAQLETGRLADRLEATRRALNFTHAELVQMRQDRDLAVNQRLQARDEVVTSQAQLLKLGADLARTRAKLDRLPTELDWAAVQADRADLRHVLARRDEELQRLKEAFLSKAGGPVTVLESELSGVDAAVLQAKVAAAYAFADELGGYCSPHGVSARYADVLRKRLDQAAEPQSAGTP